MELQILNEASKELFALLILSERLEDVAKAAKVSEGYAKADFLFLVFLFNQTSFFSFQTKFYFLP